MAKPIPLCRGVMNTKTSPTLLSSKIMAVSTHSDDIFALYDEGARIQDGFVTTLPSSEVPVAQLQILLVPSMAPHSSSTVH